MRRRTKAVDNLLDNGIIVNIRIDSIKNIALRLR
jgi:hypothetical protein